MFFICHMTITLTPLYVTCNMSNTMNTCHGFLVEQTLPSNKELRVKVEELQVEVARNCSTLVISSHHHITAVMAEYKSFHYLMHKTPDATVVHMVTGDMFSV